MRRILIGAIVGLAVAAITLHSQRTRRQTVGPLVEGEPCSIPDGGFDRPEKRFRFRRCRCPPRSLLEGGWWRSSTEVISPHR